MADPIIYECDKPGCLYRAVGATERQAIARMGRHWTALDHHEFVDAILAEDAAADEDGRGLTWDEVAEVWGRNPPPVKRGQAETLPGLEPTPTGHPDSGGLCLECGMFCTTPEHDAPGSCDLS